VKKLVRSTILLVLLVSVFTSSYNHCLSGDSVGDAAISILPEHINRIIEKRVAQQVAATNVRFEGRMAGYAQALGLGRASSSKNVSGCGRSWWMPSFGTACKAGIYLGLAGMTVYAGYCAYKKWQWVRNLVDSVHVKVRGISQKWLDIPWIKERLANIATRIGGLAQQITGLQSGQEEMQADLEKIKKDTQDIIGKLQNGVAGNEEIKSRLISIETKLDCVVRAVNVS